MRRGVGQNDNTDSRKNQALHEDDAGDEYDCILVGAGTSAMGVLRAILEDYSYEEQSPRRRIAVLEQGRDRQQERNNEDDKLVYWYAKAHAHDRNNTQLWQARLGLHRYITVPAGKGRGGTTRINAGLCCRASIRTETNPALASAAEHLQSVLSQNGVWVNSPVPMIVNPSNGNRVDYYQGLVEPLLHTTTSKTVEWFDNATCRRILYQDNQVQGVEFTTTSNNDAAAVYRRLYAPVVVVTAGVFGSPLLLAASGLVDSKRTFLLQDHIVIPAAFWGWKSQKFANNCWNGVINMPVVELNDQYTFHVSEMDATVFPVILPSLAADCLFRRTAWERWKWFLGTAYWITKFALYLLVTWTPLYLILKYVVKVLAIFLVRSPTPFNGSFRITRTQEHYKVTDIQLHYLQHKNDVDALQQFWQQHLESALSRQWCEFFPGPLVRMGFWLSRTLHVNRFRFFCQQFCLPYFHWCGSLAFLETSTNCLPVGLHICDASTLHPLPPIPPALTLAARGYVFGRSLWKKR